jgi:hypothetical protein
MLNVSIFKQSGPCRICTLVHEADYPSVCLPGGNTEAEAPKPQTMQCREPLFSTHLSVPFSRRLSLRESPPRFMMRVCTMRS